MREFLGLPLLASVHGAEVDQVIIIVHYLMLILGIGWGLFFLYTLVRFRASKNPKANYEGVTNHRSTYLEVAVVIVEIIILVGFSIPFWTKYVVAIPNESQALQVRLVAEQFAWNVHYPGEDGRFGKTDPKLIDVQSNPLGLDAADPAAKDDIATINQLYLPKDKLVTVHLSSKDVIHSFGIPYMRVKQDIIPGMVIPTSFEPTQTGQFEIACSQLCGLGHYRMRGFVQVKEAAEFDTWLGEQAKFGDLAGEAGEEVW